MVTGVRTEVALGPRADTTASVSSSGEGTVDRPGDGFFPSADAISAALTSPQGIGWSEAGGKQESRGEHGRQQVSPRGLG